MSRIFSRSVDESELIPVWSQAHPELDPSSSRSGSELVRSRLEPLPIWPQVKDLGEKMKVLNADAQLFEFGDKAEDVSSLLSSTSSDLLLIKAVWDLTWMVDSQVEAWRR